MRSNGIIGALHIVISVAYLIMFILSIGLISPYVNLTFFILMLACGILYLVDIVPRTASYALNAISLIYLVPSALFLGNYIIYLVLLLEAVTIAALVYFEKEGTKVKLAKPSPMDLPVYG